MRNSELRRRWKKSGATYLGIAGQLGVQHTSIRDAVLGHTKRPRADIATAIAAVIGAPVEEVFPALTLVSKADAATARAASAVAELADAPAAA